ncbi:MAG TPA: hypothetical protein VHT05_14955 [Candidatus Elarobacter sp.]|jgi:uncharacterized repeat protein (TIGR01451 family)|nr:hypothetical protein [Candidatus Elarobacter sp.]
MTKKLIRSLFASLATLLPLSWPLVIAKADTPPITLAISLDRSTYSVGQPTTLTIALRNNTTTTATLFTESDPLSAWRYQLGVGVFTVSAQYDIGGKPLLSNSVTVTVTPSR